MMVQLFCPKFVGIIISWLGEFIHSSHWWSTYISSSFTVVVEHSVGWHSWDMFEVILLVFLHFLS
jgi:hypothetical protein